ncbi:MAG: copper resistance protein CopC [Acidimicrobiales bacterium]|nr:copper resistance protein CopC [Acidimicrobiales bacterium]
MTGRGAFASGLARAGAFVAVVLALMVLGATAASAHANLESTSPAQSERFAAGSPPRSVAIVFDEAVNATPTSIALYDGAGHRVPVSAPGGTRTAKRIAAGLPRLADGTYAVVWHVVSDDGHPEQGAFTFGVGAGSALTADVGSLVAGRSASRGIGLGFGGVRALGFLACLVFVGGLVFVRWCWPDAAGRRDVRGLLLVAAAVAVVATLASIPLQAAYSTGGGPSTWFDGDALSAVVAARFGRAALVRAALLALLAAVALLRTGRRPAGVGTVATECLVDAMALGVWATFAYAGHGNTGRFRALGFAADMAHLGAAAFWLGGAAALALVLRQRRRTTSSARAAERFSALALPAVAVIVLSGVAQGWRQIDSWSALIHTSYARLLVVKVLVVTAILIVASGARETVRDRVVPALRAAVHRGPVADEVDDGSVELRNGIWVEVALAIVVVAVTSVLVVTPPAREAQAAASRPVARTLHLSGGDGRLTYTVVVQPALPGENTIVVTPRVATGGGFEPAALTAEVTGDARRAPVPVRFTPLADGRWVGTAPFRRAGTWRLDLTGATGPAEGRARVLVPIR